MVARLSPLFDIYESATPIRARLCRDWDGDGLREIAVAGLFDRLQGGREPGDVCVGRRRALEA